MRFCLGSLTIALLSGAFFIPAVSRGDERHLKTGDEIELTVFGEDSLGAVVKIDSSGSVNFPLVGNVEVVGKTATEVAKTVEERLEKDYIRDAHVTVRVVEEFVAKPEVKPIMPAAPKPVEFVTILGEVERPGTVEFEGRGIDLLTALAKAGGYSSLANPKRVIVKRKGAEGKAQTFYVNAADLQTGTESFTLLPGDTISVAKRIF